MQCTLYPHFPSSIPFAIRRRNSAKIPKNWYFNHRLRRWARESLQVSAFWPGFIFEFIESLTFFHCVCFWIWRQNLWPPQMVCSRFLWCFHYPWTVHSKVLFCLHSYFNAMSPRPSSIHLILVFRCHLQAKAALLKALTASKHQSRAGDLSRRARGRGYDKARYLF